MKKMRGLLSLMLVLMLLSTCLMTSSSAEKAVEPISFTDKGESFEQGYKVESGAIKIVNLSGTWREMGRQYGKLMKSELKEVYDFTKNIMDASDSNKKNAEATVSEQKNQSPYTIREFIAGAAETSGLTEEQLHIVNAVERIAGLPQCSAAFAWDDYAKDELIIGRNYDYSDIFADLNDAVVVAVYHPADGSLATATIGNVGEIYAVNALNEKGIFLELNNGTPSSNLKSPAPRITGTTLLFDMMFETDSLDFAELFFNTAACSSSFIINMADDESARSYEWCPVGVKRGDEVAEDGLMVSANHFVNPDWLFQTPTDDTSWQSLTRRDNLIALCEKNKGKIDAEKMMEIIDTSEEDGGAMNEFTVYQLVVVPETLTLWLKVVGSADWTQIDMKSFLVTEKAK